PSCKGRSRPGARRAGARPQPHPAVTAGSDLAELPVDLLPDLGQAEALVGSQTSLPEGVIVDVGVDGHAQLLSPGPLGGGVPLDLVGGLHAGLVALLDQDLLVLL